MNRHDEIHAAARDVATHIHIDPARRDAMADDLIKLIGLMIQGVGKYVAVRGESDMNLDEEEENEGGVGYATYIVGERVQDAARELAEDCQGADLDRYHRPNGTEWCKCGHHPALHRPGVCDGLAGNGHPCYSGERPCEGFDVKLREPVWTHEDRRPDVLRALDAPVAPQCDVVSVNGTRCVKAAGHWTPRNSNVHEFHHPIQRGALPAATNDTPTWATYRPTATDVAECCHGTGPCPWSRVKAGGCCYPKNAICPTHH